MSVLKLYIGVFFIMVVLAYSAHGAATSQKPTLSPAKISHAAISAILPWRGKTAKVLSHIDLTKPFDTKSQWTLVVLQDPRIPNDEVGSWQMNGPIAVCFLKGLSPQCRERHGTWSLSPEFATMYHLLGASVVYAGQDSTHPLLWLKTCSANSGDGSCGVRAEVYDYDRKSDTFRSVFTDEVGASNNNANARFVKQGPLRGDIIVDYPTEHPPYVYWIEVYGLGKSDRYRRILRYRSHTGYGDGNPLPVAYSEMPEIMRRLGYWSPGDALPVPPNIPCPHPVLRHMEEWCQGH